MDADQGVTPDHSADNFIQKVEILHAGNVLETIDNYQILSSILMGTQVDLSTRATSFNITKGCSSTYATLAGTNIAKHSVNDANGQWYSLTLLSGICGSLSRSYIPVFELQGSLSMRITFATSLQIGKWDAAPTTTSNSNFKFNKIEFHANYVF